MQKGVLQNSMIEMEQGNGGYRPGSLHGKTILNSSQQVEMRIASGEINHE
jgi:hypothetical protein